MRTVLHILPMNKLSGAEKVALLICRNLKEYRPIVVCGGNELAEFFGEYGIETCVLNFSSRNILSNIFGLKKIINEKEVEIIHAHDNNASVLALLSKRISNKKIKIISHIHSCYPWLKFENINKKIDGIFRPKYDLNITCGKLVQEFYKEYVDYFEEEKYKIYSNAIDLEEIEKITSNQKEIDIKEKNILLNEKIIIGFIGRLERVKGLIPFIKKLATKKELFNDCKFLVVGDGSLEEDIKELVKNLNLEEFFIFLGFQKDVYKIYPIIDIFFLPSLYEGLPMVVLEAMAFKKAIVSTNVGSLAEVIDNNRNGFLINNNLDEFLEKLYELKIDKSKRILFGENAFKTVEEEYSMNKYNENLEILYKEILE